MEQKREVISSEREFAFMKDLTFWIGTTAPGWLLASLTESTLIADISSVWASFVLFRWLWSSIGRPYEMVRFLRLGAFSLCVIQNLSWIVANVLHRFSLDKSIIVSLYDSMGGGLTFSSYALAIFYTSVFGATLSYFGSGKMISSLERKLASSLHNVKRLAIKKVVWFLLIITIVEILLVRSGVIGQRSILVEGYEEGERPAWIVFFESLLPAQILLNALLALRLWKGSNSSYWYWLVLIISVTVMAFIYFNKGRTPLVFAFFSFGYWLIFFAGTKPSLKKLFLTVIIIYPILSQILLFSNFIRGANGVADFRSQSAIDILPAAWESFTSSTSAIEEEKVATTANLATRPLIAIPLAYCLQFPQEAKSFTLGENLFNSIIWAIPGPIFPNKKDYPIQEALLYQHFPIGKDSKEDTADSLYLSSYTEFSWAGILIYPLLLTCLWIAVIQINSKFHVTGIFVVITIALFFYNFLIGVGEGSVGGWIVVFRSFLFWVVISSIFKRFNKKKIVHSKDNYVQNPLYRE